MQSRQSVPEQGRTVKAPSPVKLNMTVPVISGGALQGYVLTQVAVLLKADSLASLPQPPDLLLTDEVFKTVYAEEQIDFKHMEKIDLVKLSKKIVQNINDRAGAPVTDDVYIQELHYMSKQDASPEAQSRHQR
jgi:hypothetical protein